MVVHPESAAQSSQVRSAVSNLLAILPGWSRLDNYNLARVDGAVMQVIGIDVLRSGEYRTMSYIHVLAAIETPGKVRVDFLDGRTLTTIPFARNSNRTSNLVREMVDTLAIDVSLPLCEEEALNWSEAQAKPTPSQAFALAALNGSVGNVERAAHWCRAYNGIVDAIGRPWANWHLAQRAFLDRLENWIKAGVAKEELGQVVAEEARLFGFQS